MNKTKLYWLSQVGGWLFFMLIETVTYATVFGYNRLLVLNVFINFVLGILLTHTYRVVILKINLLKLTLAKLIPRALVLIILISLFLSFFNIWLDRVTVPEFKRIPVNVALIIGYLFNWSKYILLWALIYHLFQYWEKSLEAERDKYRLEATLKENQYNNLKTQLNPHFLFNSLNGIRTLVDANPVIAKQAITKLCNLLRSSLQMSHYKTVSLKQELETVNDYLDIELLRFDDRLKVTYNIDEKALEQHVPPMMLQTLAENAIKHGISKLKQGGSITFNIYLKDKLYIEIINSGNYKPTPNESESGYGINNTIERLKLLYDNNAQFYIDALDEQNVITKISLPI
ncbi:MAG: sensor histidine kinase [Bacteroidia bacterium]